MWKDIINTYIYITQTRQSRSANYRHILNAAQSAHAHYLWEMMGSHLLVRYAANTQEVYSQHVLTLAK